MGNLIRMDLYRMNRSRSFRICLILTFAFALLSTPVEKLFFSLGRMLAPDELDIFPASVNLSSLIGSPAGLLGIMLAMLSVVSFFYADMENGYIKNIAGQMPRRGFSILSRFIAAIPHNLVFLLAGLAGTVIGTLPFRQIALDSGVLESIGTFFLKLLLLQSVCSILLLVTASLRSKSFGMILAVLMGLSLTGLIYLGLNSGLQQLFGDSFNLVPYMPDQVLQEAKPEFTRALLVSAVTTGVFLPAAIRIFDRNDVK